MIYENNPTYANLVGRVEHVAREGVLTTDFTLIKAGALQRANGGYLILDARRLLQQPFAYDALKRALQAGEVRIESPGEALSLITTISLEPEPVPLDVKVVLIGEPQLYYLLTQYDPDFEKLFKVAADLDAEIDRDGAEPLYARLVATLVKERALRPFDRSAVERVIEESARMAGDASKLSSKVEDVGDLVRESDYWAGEAGAPVVDREHVERAVEARIFRLDRLRERMQEMTLRDLIYIDTDGARVGSGQRALGDQPRQLHVRPPDADQRAGADGQRPRHQRRARGGAVGADPLQGRAHPVRVPGRALRARAAALDLRQPRLRAVVQRRRRRQRVVDRALRAALGARRAAAQAVAGGDRLGQPARAWCSRSAAPTRRSKASSTSATRAG